MRWRLTSLGWNKALYPDAQRIQWYCNSVNSSWLITHILKVQSYTGSLYCCVLLFFWDSGLCVLSYPVAAGTLHPSSFPPSLHSTWLWIQRALTWTVTEERQKSLSCGSICHEAFNFREEPVSTLKVTWALDKQTAQDGLFWLSPGGADFPKLLHTAIWTLIWKPHNWILNIVTSLSCELVLLSKIKIFLQITGTPVESR